MQRLIQRADAAVDEPTSEFIRKAALAKAETVFGAQAFYPKFGFVPVQLREYRLVIC